MSAYQDINALSALGCNEINLRSASDECFPGQYFDGETNLHYNYFRDYDPLTGRYIQSDPIGLDGRMNTYGYVLQNPQNSIDRLGLLSCPKGVWSATSDYSAALLLGGGITGDRMTYTCESNGKSCTATAFCFGGGAAASIGLYGQTVKGRIVGVTDSKQFEGYSTGVYIAGGPLSATITGSGATIAAEIGVTIGAFAIVSCTNFHLQCEGDNCPK